MTEARTRACERVPGRARHDSLGAPGLRVLLVVLVAAASAISPLILPARPAAALTRATDQRLGVPAYFFDSQQWDRVFESTTSTGYVVFNPDSGPGSTAFATWVDYRERLRVAQQSALGYVYTARGTRPVSTVVDEANRHYGFYGVDGIFLDDTGRDCSLVPYYQTVVGQIRAAHPGAVIAMNPQDNVPECFSSLADLFVIFQGPKAAYDGWSPAAWVGNFPASKFWHIVYDVSRTDLAAVVETAKNRQAGIVHLTDDTTPNPWDVFPAADYWSALVTAVRGVPYTPVVESHAPISGQRLGMPMFSVPEDPAWDRALATAEATALVINPASGAGTEPITGLLARRNQARSAGKQVFGYMSTAYTARPLETARAEIQNYLTFYDVDGVFVDEVAPNCSDAPYYQTLSTELKSRKQNALLVLNPGVNLGECFMAFTDRVVNFEGRASSYVAWKPSLWTYRYGADRFWQLVYATPREQVPAIVDLSKRRNAGFVHVVDDDLPNPWDVLPSDAYLAAVRSAMTGAPVAPPVQTVATGSLVSVRPSVRVLDTRDGTGAGGPVRAGGIVSLALAGRAGVPSTGVGAVALNVVAVGPSEATHVTAYPSGSPVPTTSNLNVAAGEVRANLVIVKLGASGSVDLRNHSGSTHLVADLVGYYPTGSGFTAVEPLRLGDSRQAGGPLAGALGPGAERSVLVAGSAAVPAGAVAVVLNVTVTDVDTATHVTVSPSGSPATTSAVNVSPGQTAANLVIVRPGGDGAVTVRNNSGSAHVVLDLMGYFASGYTPLAGSRLADTRDGTGSVTRGEFVTIQVAGVGGIPASGVGAVALNVTAVSPNGGVTVTAYPSGESAPETSVLNAGTWPATPNLVLVRVGADGRVVLRTNVGGAHLVADAQGWFPAA